MNIVNYIDINSYNRCTNSADQVMIYGWSHCSFHEIDHMIQNHLIGKKKSGKITLSSRMIKVFNWEIGDPFSQNYPAKLTTREDRVIEQIAVSPKSYRDPHAHLCKAGLTNLVLENLKRRGEKLPIIPLLFVIECNYNGYPSSPKTILSRDKKLNSLVTHKELRRAFRIVKLAQELKFRDLEFVCNKTFCFVKNETKRNKAKVRLEKINAPWKEKKWDKLWKKRMEAKPKEKTPKPEELKWQNYFVHFNTFAKMNQKEGHS